MTTDSAILWAALPDALSARRDLRAKIEPGHPMLAKLTEEDRPERDWAGNKLPRMSILDTEPRTAIIPVNGVLLNKATALDRWLGDTGYEDVLEDVAAAIQARCKRIVLEIDSPGGHATGVHETRAKIMDMARAGEADLLAYTGGQMTSAAYLIATASPVILALPSAQVGSVGAIVTFLTFENRLRDMGVTPHVLASDELKATGHPFLAASQQQLDFIQEYIDEIADEFKRCVMEARGDNLELAALDARVVSGRRAAQMGLIDEVVPSLGDWLSL